MEVLSVLAGYSGGSVITRFQNMIPITLNTKNILQKNTSDGKNVPCSFNDSNNILPIDQDTAGNENENENHDNFGIFPLICRKNSPKSDTSIPNSVIELNRNPKSLLFHYFSSIVHFISKSLLPIQNVSRRMNGIDVLEHLFNLLLHELPERSMKNKNTPEKFHHYCSGRKIMSYEIRENIRKNSLNGNFRDGSFDTIDDDEMYRSLCVVSSVGVDVALSALSDGSDAVCAAGVSALYVSVPLIMQDEEIKVGNIILTFSHNILLYQQLHIRLYSIYFLLIFNTYSLQLILQLFSTITYYNYLLQLF